MKAGSILSVRNLTKEYGHFKAVDDVSFEIKPGEILGILGPNGAGKTTTLNMILGVVEQNRGEIYFLGKKVGQDRSRVNRNFNFAAVYASLPGNLAVKENLLFFGLLYGVPKLKERVEELIEEFNLKEFKNSKAGTLSSGEQSRVHLAKALLNKPKLLLLDEPTASLDPSSSQLMREKIKAYAKNSAAGILWTSHNMYEIESVCDHVLFLSHGKILLSGDPRTLPQEYGKENLEELFIAVAREPLSLENGKNL